MASTTQKSSIPTTPSDQLDADIAGPGVIIGFMLSNFLTLTAATTTLWLHRRPKRKLLALPAAQWQPILNNFVRALSDQQLITGLLLMIIGLAKYYIGSVRHGVNNLWTAGDIVVFSSVTHAMTLITLRPYFRIHRRLATFRVALMWIIYGLWIVVAASILSPNKPSSSTKLNYRLRDFWHAATWLEVFCIAYMYLITIFPIFISEDAAKVREVIARASHNEEDLSVIKRWVYTRPRSNSILTHRHSPYGRIRGFIKGLSRAYCRKYLELAEDVSHASEQVKARRKFEVWAACAEALWPWYSILVLVLLLWLFGFGTMIVNLHQNKMLDQWTFGQLLPPVFILLPLYDVVSDFSEKRIHPADNREVMALPHDLV